MGKSIENPLFKVWSEDDGLVYSIVAKGSVLSNKSRESIAAMAIPVNSPIARVIGSLFPWIRKTRCPRKLFTSKEESVSWPKDFL